MSRALRELAHKQKKQSDFYKKLAISETNFEKGKAFREEKNKALKKFLFLKNLNNAIEKNDVSRET